MLCTVLGSTFALFTSQLLGRVAQVVKPKPLPVFDLHPGFLRGRPEMVGDERGRGEGNAGLLPFRKETRSPCLSCEASGPPTLADAAARWNAAEHIRPMHPSWSGRPCHPPRALTPGFFSLPTRCQPSAAPESPMTGALSQRR